MNRLQGASLETILDAVEKAVAEEDRPILEEIDRQIEEYDAQPPRVVRAYGAERTIEPVHGFEEWLLLLHDGAASLPDRLPRSVLIAWRDRYHPPRPELTRYGLNGGPVSPGPFWRCEDCRMVLPHGVPPGWPDEGCPVCGSARVWHADHSKPLSAAWINPHAVRRGAEV
ncbi:MAG TPA: hypothetical protein VH643_11660 [Gemmataceae bacterium]|jgi:hypothetical protein